MEGKKVKQASSLQMITFYPRIIEYKFVRFYLNCWGRILRGHVGREDRRVEGKDHERRDTRHEVDNPRGRRPHRDRVVAL